MKELMNEKEMMMKSAVRQILAGHLLSSLTSENPMR